jgi:histidine kinase
MRLMHRLSVRLFLSYLAVVALAAVAAFVTARLLAPTFFEGNLERARIQIGPVDGTGSPADGGTPVTVGPGPTATSGAPGGSGDRGTGGTADPGDSGDPGGSQGSGGTGSGGSGSGGSGSGEPGGAGGGSGSAGDASAVVGVSALAIPASATVREEADAAFRSAVDTALLVGLAVGLVVAAVAAALVSRRIMRPLGRVRRATLRLAAGHYDERVPVPAEAELAALARDVNTLAVTLEETEQRRARLISDVAHELRTPLTTIQGSMEGLIDGVLEPSDEVFASVADEAARLMRVAGDLGVLSRFDEGAVQLDMRPLDPAEVARRVGVRLRPQFDDKGVSLAFEAAEPGMVAGDADRLAQVFTNLLGNALAHTPAGGHVTVRTGTADGWRETVVADTGEGIAAADLERIFERFYRAGGREGRGTGIGLTIARAIARTHGGDVTARSGGPGTGAELVVRLPPLR